LINLHTIILPSVSFISLSSSFFPLPFPSPPIDAFLQTDTFANFTTSFVRTTTNSARTFANTSGLKQYKLTFYIVAGFVGVWVLWKLGASHWGREDVTPA
jgi:hypothetical protein